MSIVVQAEPFDAASELAAFTRSMSGTGGVASFLGLVRGEHEGRVVHAMTLEHYPGMTEKLLAEIAEEAMTRWPLDKLRIVHRHGRMLPGEPIVLVLTASAHRRAALEACSFLIDWLKTRAPFWKLEETDEGEVWVEAKASDDDAAARWERDTR